jgi:hypothetical protein
LGVPAFDAVIQIGGQDSDVDGLDDVLAEVLEAFVLVDLALQRTIQARVFDSNADVPGERAQKLDIIA